MRPVRTSTIVILFLSALSILYVSSVPKAQAQSPPPGYVYSLSAVPSYAQEGTVTSLVLTVQFPAISSTTFFQFSFNVRSPAGIVYQSKLLNVTVLPGTSEFTRIVAYPGPYFALSTNSLLGQYSVSVDQLQPSGLPSVASTLFVLGLTDSPSYERTQTVNVQATVYNASESVGVTVKTQTTSTIVFSRTIAASATGVVTASWKTLPNSTIDSYIVSLTGTSTHKVPSDTQTFSVRAATMMTAVIASYKSTYQRTETMKFSFQPTYPDGTVPANGVGLLTLSGPTGKGVTLTATYDGPSQMFNASYQTTSNNQTGTWTASIGAHGYSDPFGNNGPGVVVTNSPQLVPANLAIVVLTNTIISVGQQLRFNATVDYPDGSNAQPSNLRAFLIYSGTPQINDTVPVVYDSALGHWVGTYTAKGSDTGGLWSLVLFASDSATPSNSGTTTRAITIQNSLSSGAGSIPLYLFGIMAAIIAAILLAVLVLFKRRRIGHASLKIDLEAVHSEAGRIQSGEFFKTIKEQVQKEQEDKT